MYFTSFVITRTSLFRGSLHRGSIVAFSKFFLHDTLSGFLDDLRFVGA